MLFSSVSCSISDSRFFTVADMTANSSTAVWCNPDSCAACNFHLLVSCIRNFCSSNSSLDRTCSAASVSLIFPMITSARSDTSFCTASFILVLSTSFCRAFTLRQSSATCTCESCSSICSFDTSFSRFSASSMDCLSAAWAAFISLSFVASSSLYCVRSDSQAAFSSESWRVRVSMYVFAFVSRSSKLLTASRSAADWAMSFSIVSLACSKALSSSSMRTLLWESSRSSVCNWCFIVAISDWFFSRSSLSLVISLPAAARVSCNSINVFSCFLSFM